MTTEEIPIEDRVKWATEFLLASPPGEVNDVLSDVRALVNNDEALTAGIQLAFEQYNKEQLIAFKHEFGEVIISEAGQLKGEDNRYLDSRAKKTFKVDHIKQEVSDIQEANVDEPMEALRSAIDEEILAYVQDHFRGGVCAVFGNKDRIDIAIVNNKYNSKNLWNGRWRATWSLDTQSGKLTGETKINVHVFEEGNIQLDTTKKAETNISIKEDVCSTAKSVAEAIQRADKEHQKEIQKRYETLGKRIMRRVLPKKGGKIDWNSDLTNSKVHAQLAKDANK